MYLWTGVLGLNMRINKALMCFDWTDYDWLSSYVLLYLSLSTGDSIMYYWGARYKASSWHTNTQTIKAAMTTPLQSQPLTALISVLILLLYWFRQGGSEFQLLWVHLYICLGQQ